MGDAGRILVVDDDEAQLRLLQTVLEADGWTVLPAGSGEQALALLERGEEIDVILSDLVMPGVAVPLPRQADQAARAQDRRAARPRDDGDPARAGPAAPARRAPCRRRRRVSADGGGPRDGNPHRAHG